MKKWSVIMAVVMALLILVVVPISALAQTDDEVTSDTAPRLRDGLAIVAPLGAPVATEISMTVFRCSDQEPVEGAHVWLVAKDKLETLRQEMAAVRGGDGLDAGQDDYERLLGVHGTPLGQTDGEGKLWYSFDNAGRYLLVAVMGGYLPDFRAITVGMLPRALAIDAPRRAEVGENVTITVFQRGTEAPVKDAGVWALTREDAETLKADMAGIRESGDQDTIGAAVEEACDVHGIFLGTTNGAGKVKYAFEDAGGYLLVTVKRGYFPGWKPIAIGTMLRALAIDAPRRAEVGENVTITVFQRGTEAPVKDAGVWALTREDAETLKADMAGIRESGDQDTIGAAVEEACDVHGIFLGTTNGAGKVKYAFEDAGGYLLVTVKRGYFPGWKPIVIVPETGAKALERPGSLDEGSGIRPGLQ